MSRSILTPNDRRIEEGSGRDGIAGEPKKVDGRKVDGETQGRLASPVEDGLRIERR